MRPARLCALTSDPADESEPAFSPDGSRIAFRSERDGGGIYVVSAFGGEPRLDRQTWPPPAVFSRRHSTSRTGSRSACYVGKVFIVPAAGGAPTPIQPEFASALVSRSGRPTERVAVPGGAAIQRTFRRMRLTGGSLRGLAVRAVKTGAFDILQAPGDQGGKTASLVDRARRLDWRSTCSFPAGRTRARTCGGSSVSPETGKAEGSAQKLTSGTSIEAKPSVIPGGRIAFASLNQCSQYLEPADRGQQRQVSGGPQQVTSSAFDARTSVSADGKKLVFISTRLGNPDVWMKDLESGKETALTATPAREEEAEITADGTRICYMVIEGSRVGCLSDRDNRRCARKNLRRLRATLGLVAGRQADPLPDRRRPQAGRPSRSVCSTSRRARRRTISNIPTTVWRGRGFRRMGAGSVSWPSTQRALTSSLCPFQSRCAAAERRMDLDHRACDRSLRTNRGGLPMATSSTTRLTSMAFAASGPGVWTRQPSARSGQPLDVYHSHSARRSLMNAGIPFPGALSDRGQAVLQSGRNHGQHLDGGVEAVMLTSAADSSFLSAAAAHAVGGPTRPPRRLMS